MNSPIPFLTILFLILHFNLSAQIEAHHLGIEVGPFSKKKFVEGSNYISKNEFEARLETNPAAFAQYKSGKNLNTTSAVLGVPSGLIFGFYLGRSLGGGEKPSGTLFAVSGIVWGGAVAMGIIGNGKINKAIRSYNAGGDVGLEFRITGDGAGLVVMF